MSKHPHAELMALYAQDAMETDKPWERWEFKSPDLDVWNSFKMCRPTWEPIYEYRRKPRTIRIGEYDVPEPVREAPDIEQFYFHVEFLADDGIHGHYWKGTVHDYRLLERGLVHIDPKAAEIHSKALISLSAKGGAE
jgi:hypothetical protein